MGNRLQAMFDAFTAQEANKRSATQITLGEFILILKSFEPHLPVKLQDGSSLGEPNSYRGYYSDLAFSPIAAPNNVGAILNLAEGALGKSFYGYKGGDNIMSKNTPLWVASYGNCGVKITSCDLIDGAILITTQEDEY